MKFKTELRRADEKDPVTFPIANMKAGDWAIIHSVGAKVAADLVGRPVTRLSENKDPQFRVLKEDGHQDIMGVGQVPMTVRDLGDYEVVIRQEKQND